MIIVLIIVIIISVFLSVLINSSHMLPTVTQIHEFVLKNYCYEHT